MTEGEGLTVMHRLILNFPTLAGNREVQAQLMRELSDFGLAAVQDAVGEYMTLGEKFVNPGQLVAIANRCHRQYLERSAEAERTQQKAAERAQAQRLRDARASVATFIAEMSDAEVMAEWRPLLEQLTGLPRQWAEQWGPEKVRNNARFQFHVSQLLQRKPVA